MDVTALESAQDGLLKIYREPGRLRVPGNFEGTGEAVG